MTEYLRKDNIRAFPCDEPFLNKIMEENKIKNRSEAYRFAVKLYHKNKEAPQEIANLKTEIVDLKKTIEELTMVVNDVYYIVSAMKEQVGSENESK